MIILKLGFLLGLPLDSPKTEASNIDQEKEIKKDESSKKFKSRKSEPSKASSKKSKKSSKDSEVSRKSTAKEKVQKEKPPLPEYAFEVGKPKGFFHIEYQLFSHLKPCHIDIWHWEEISKIYFQSQTAIYKHVIRDNTIWIPVMLEHKISEPLSEEELLGLKNFVIEFVVSPNKKNMCAEAKGERTKVFFIKEEDIGCESYVEAFDIDPNVHRSTSQKLHSSSSSKKSTLYENESMYSILKQFDHSLLHPRFQKILKKLEKGEQITCKHFIPPSLEPFQEVFEAEPDRNDVNNYIWPKGKKSARQSNVGKDKKDKKDKKKKQSDRKSKSSKDSKKPRKSANDKPAKLKKEAKIKVSGESYFTDAALCTYRLNEEIDNINDIFIVFSTWNLTTPEMLCALKPLVVKLKSLRNVPVDYLMEQKFESINLQYNIPGIGRHVTESILLKDVKDPKKIKINESHIYFQISLKEMSFLAICSRLFIELVGVYNDEPDISPSLFGTLKSDRVRIPPKPQEIVFPKPKSLVLAVACYDLSLFLQSRTDLELIECLRHPTNNNAQRITAQYKNNKFVRELNIEQIHLNYPTDPWPSPLVDAILIEADTTLKIHISLGCKIRRFAVEEEPVLKYKRLLLILYDTEIASYLLSNILCYNQQFRKSVLLENYAMYTERLQKLNEIDPKGHILTGFFIDNGNSVLIFLEGCRANYCMEIILYQIKCMNESLCKLFYNTATYFYNRIYENFLAFGGIYKITLKYQLQNIFKAQSTHISLNLPKPAFEAAKKLEYLLELQSMVTISQHGIFPTCNELLSFDMEFGVPHITEKMY